MRAAARRLRRPARGQAGAGPGRRRRAPRAGWDPAWRARSRASATRRRWWWPAPSTSRRSASSTPRAWHGPARLPAAHPGHRGGPADARRLRPAARLTPYDVPTRRGELKYLLVTEGDGSWCGSCCGPPRRWPGSASTCRGCRGAGSDRGVGEHPAGAQGGARGRAARSCWSATQLAMPVGDVVLHLRPESFFQTNTAVAAALYADARTWTRDPPPTAWDLFCGVGGFALHVAGPGREVLGVELSGEAVASATLSPRPGGAHGRRFLAGDAVAFARDAGPAPDLVVVNPPRRGIGAWPDGWRVRRPARALLQLQRRHPGTDLAAMPSLVPRRARLFDMFPHTAHHEVLVLLDRRDGHRAVPYPARRARAPRSIGACPPRPTRDGAAALGRAVLVGALGGLLSGAFGVGGGIVMVPLLMSLAKMDQRRASAPRWPRSCRRRSPAPSATSPRPGDLGIALRRGRRHRGLVDRDLAAAPLPMHVLRWLFVGAARRGGGTDDHRAAVARLGDRARRVDGRSRWSASDWSWGSPPGCSGSAAGWSWYPRWCCCSAWATCSPRARRCWSWCPPRWPARWSTPAAGWWTCARAAGRCSRPPRLVPRRGPGLLDAGPAAACCSRARARHGADGVRAIRKR